MAEAKTIGAVCKHCGQWIRWKVGWKHWTTDMEGKFWRCEPTEKEPVRSHEPA